MPFPIFLSFSTLAVAGAIALICFKNPVSSAMSMVASFLGMAGLFFGMNAYFVGIIQILVYTGAIMVLFLFIIMLLDLKVAEKVTFKGSSIAAAVIVPLAIVIQLVGVLGGTPDVDPKREDLSKEKLAGVAGPFVFGPDDIALNTEDEDFEGFIGNPRALDASPRKPSEVPDWMKVEPEATYYPYGKDTKITEELSAGRLPDVHLIGHKIFTEYNAPLQVMGLLLFVATIGCVVLSQKDKTTPTKSAE